MPQKLVILGGGESGVGAALLGKAKGYDVFLSDSGSLAAPFREELKQAGISYEEGGHTEKSLLAADEVIKSPGIPQTAAVIKRIREAGITISSEIDFASRFTNASIVAITGTNGKTTTTLLTGHLLREAGFDVVVAGNIGDSFARAVAEREPDYFVLEISSFQLEDIHAFRPHVAMLLNITPDHLDRYEGSMDRYAAAKFRIVENLQPGDTFIYNADDEQIAKVMNHRENKGIWAEQFSGAFYQENALHIPRLQPPFAAAMEQLDEGKEVFDQLPLRGKHNALNMSAAILAAMRVGLGADEIRKGLATFKNAPHRLEEVATINGVTFINDSKATNVDAVSFALDAFETPIIWIAGGIDKGNDYEQIRGKVEKHVKSIVCLGKDNEKLLKAFSETVSFIDETQDIKEAVVKAYHLAEKGEIVLLSPACASFDLFKNYMDRGDKFKEAIQQQLESLRPKKDFNLRMIAL